MSRAYKPIVRLRTFLFSHVVTRLVRAFYVHVWGMDVGRGSRISLSAKLDKTNPSGVHIGDNSAVTFGASILTHDFVNGVHVDTWIGSNSFIGAHSVIMPGVRIGDHCIVAPASVVMRNVPSNTLVMGNPARVIEQNIETGPLGKRIRRPAPAADDAATAPAAAEVAVAAQG